MMLDFSTGNIETLNSSQSSIAIWIEILLYYAHNFKPLFVIPRTFDYLLLTNKTKPLTVNRLQNWWSLRSNRPVCFANW